MKEAVTKVITHSHKRTSMGPSRSCWNGTTSALLPEEITSKGTRVSCVSIKRVSIKRVSIKVPIRKKCGNLFNDPRMCSFVVNTVFSFTNCSPGVGNKVNFQAEYGLSEF